MSDNSRFEVWNTNPQKLLPSGSRIILYGKFGTIRFVDKTLVVEDVQYLPVDTEDECEQFLEHMRKNPKLYGEYYFIPIMRGELY